MSTVPAAGDTVVDIPPVTDPPSIPAGIMHWHGNATGSWWAVLPGRQGPQLVEAFSEDHLAARVDWHLRRAAW